ncbi:hypothetical protein EOL70_12610 [Leucothrix sargassi]|nr:hypothetical protein EOL70_12610 [Leucothrix sargassi]
MPVMVSAPTNAEETMSHCEKMKMSQQESALQKVDLSQFDNACNMENCQCDALNTAKVPDELFSYSATHFGTSSPMMMDVPSLLSQYLLPNQRPPRFMPA